MQIRIIPETVIFTLFAIKLNWGKRQLINLQSFSMPGICKVIIPPTGSNRAQNNV